LALNKRKVLEAARKHAQKGAKAKALKEYNKLLKLDSHDAKLLLEVGDAYRRWGQVEEAIAQYGKVAQQYRQDGFDARSVAVFKQILNLDPKQYSAYVSLAELYQRMGLDSEAIGALQAAADGYHSEGRKADALDLLRQTAALDPTNTTSRLKVAELLRQEGMESEALSEYMAVAEELKTQRNHEQLATVQERILELRPDEMETLSALVRNLMSSGQIDRAETFAVRALNVAAEPAQYELLIDLYAQGGNDPKLADAIRGLAKLYRDRGDEEKARELMQRLPAGDAESSGRLEVDISDIAEPELGDDELLEEEPFLAATDEHEDTNGANASGGANIGREPDAVVPPETKASVDREALPEGDPDQLLAEANVYLRYGKRDQAIASLRGVIAQDPNHRAALEKLGEAYGDDGQDVEAVNAWKRAAIEVKQAGDHEAFSVLKDRIAALDPAAAEQIGSMDVGAATDSEPEFDFDVDLDFDDAIDEVAASESKSSIDFDAGADDFEIEIDADPIEFEFETDPPAPSSPESSPATAVSTQPTPSGVGDDESEEFVFDIDVDDDEASPAAVSTSEQSSMAAQKVTEELEEAEFYIAQEMFDEAEGILARILEQVPNHPAATLRMGEIEAARGQRSEEARSESVAEASQTEVSESTSGAATNEFEETARLDDIEPNDDLEINVGVEVEVEVEVEVDLGSEEETGDTETAQVSGGATVGLAADDSAVIGEDDDDTLTAVAAGASDDGSTDPSEVAQTPVASANAPDPGATFDLREALADVLAEDEVLESGNSSSAVLSTVDDGFGSIFSDFKKGVSEVLEEGDYETRYDLGLAYREMGLYEDAIGEFRICLDSESRRFDSLHLMGICARDLSRFEDSVNYFEQALATAEILEERLVGVYFELSFAQEGLGDVGRATASVRKVLEIDADFPAARERLATLEAGSSSSPVLDEPNTEYESFDELFEDDDDDAGGDVAMVEAVPTETFESFEDVIADAERAIEAEESASGEGSGGETGSAKKPVRKKISFV